jgi:cytochrome c oxidase subunit II
MRRARLAASVAALALLSTACSATFGLPKGQTEQGGDISSLWTTFMTAGIVIAAIVYALIVFSILRYRRRRTDTEETLGRQFRANIPLEIVYTAIPVLIVIGLFTLSLRTERKVDAVSADPGVVLDAQAFSWGWRFSYPDLGITVVSQPSGPGVPGPVIELPVDETTQVDLSSQDVIHAFWVPAFNFKRDAIPGNPTSFDLSPQDQGDFRGVCAEFCGLNHAYMGFTVRVVDRTTFDAWVAQQRQASPGGTA